MPSSLTILLPSALGFSPHPPVSVYGTGRYETIAAFLGKRNTVLRYFKFAIHRAFALVHVLSAHQLPRLDRFFHSRFTSSSLVPARSVYIRYWNLNQFSIDYAIKPRLRPRLTQGRSALPWKPWIFGRKDSHLTLATHSGILPSRSSTSSHESRFVGFDNAPLPLASQTHSFAGTF